MASNFRPLTEKLIDHVHQVTVKEHPVLKEIEAFNQDLEEKVMQISPIQGDFMAFMVKSVGARKAIEVGVFTGFSSTTVAMALPDDGEFHAFEIDEHWADISQEFWKKAGVDHKMTLHMGKALETMKAFLQDEAQLNTFDFAFIDADKWHVCEYYEMILKLLKPGGLLLIDNCFLSGSVTKDLTESRAVVAMRELSFSLKDDKRVDFTLLPIADGVMMVRKLSIK